MAYRDTINEHNMVMFSHSGEGRPVLSEFTGMSAPITFLRRQPLARGKTKNLGKKLSKIFQC